MHTSIFNLVIVVISLHICGNVFAQSNNYYYEHNTRYGTFRHYSNGGAKLVSGIDYAAQIAESQQQSARAAQERAANRAKEIERMRKAQYPSAQNSTSSEVRNYNPPAPVVDVVKQREIYNDAYHQQYEILLEKATTLSHQALILNEMQRFKPSQATALRLFGVYAQLGDLENLRRVEGFFTPEFFKENQEIIYAGMGSAYFRKAIYTKSLMYHDDLEQPDLNSFTENLCARIQLKKWSEARLLMEQKSSNFPELSTIAPSLTQAFAILEKGETSSPQAHSLASTLYQFAVQRREKRQLNFLNILALNLAVNLEPDNADYREERFNANSILNLEMAMQDDYDYFNK